MIFVNQEKVARAKEILAFITREKTPLTEEQVSSMERWSRHLSASNVDPKSEEAVEFVYSKLGGLVRTEAEQRKFLDKVAGLRKRKKSE